MPAGRVGRRVGHGTHLGHGVGHREGQADPAHRVLRISISDNGPGIPDNIAPRIFRPFFTTKAQGTGLGLALVQKIVVTHNGRITAGNDDDGGARFVVTLPVTSEA